MWGVAVACSTASGAGELRDAVINDARSAVDESVVDDAMAAAAIMGMNNVYYRLTVRAVSGVPCRARFTTASS